jgi:CRISPR-associated endoribonuclease Cas2
VNARLLQVDKMHFGRSRVQAIFFKRGYVMKKKINYNYAFVFYDVGEKRVQKVFKICKKYLSHFQNSVFRGEMSPSKLVSLRSDLKKVLVLEEDFVCIIKLLNGNVFGEEVFGGKERTTGEDLII